MPSLNAVYLQGHLTSDPELRTMPSGKQLLTFTISHNRSFQKNGEWTKETSYIDIKVWGSLGERVAPSLSKGVEVIVSGHLEQERWVSADGRKQSQVVVIAERVSVFAALKPEKRPPSMPSYRDTIPF